MKLPNYEQAVVPEAKIVRYLLNLGHQGKGKDKARFFTHFVFSVEQCEIMRLSLLQHAQSYEVANSLVTPEGVHYVIDGELNTPDGRNPKVRTIWAIDKDNLQPRFITAYPLR